MKHILIQQVMNMAEAGTELTVRGWVRTSREAKDLIFLEVNDGSCLGNLQAILEGPCLDHPDLPLANTGASVELKGRLVLSPAKGQKYELKVNEFRLLGPADQDSYPLQKKRHSEEFLRAIAHLRPRTNRFGAMFRIRSRAAMAIHEFFQKQHFHYAHTPILTPSDCEGAGQMFRVSASLAGQGPDFSREFFNHPAFLCVSGQLEAEALATALGRVYTFGPAFRAENSNTARHASEFWMVEPEMAFFDLNDDMDLAEEFIVNITRQVMESCQEDLSLFFRFIDNKLEQFLLNLIEKPFARISYTEAVRLLEAAKARFEYPVAWGLDLQTEHEKWLCEEYFKRPVMVYDYPKEIKAFYMRRNDDNQTVAAMDVLMPRIGELIGGSQREERPAVLEQALSEAGLDLETYAWYLDLRRYGTVPHAGFGLGFERFLMLITGSANIRDVIAFPRTPQHLEF